MFSCSKLLVIYYLCDSAYPSSYGFTGSISSASCVLILTQYKSSLSICTILFIRSVTKWGYFITYIEEILVKNIVQVYIKEVFARYRVLNKIILIKI